MQYSLTVSIIFLFLFPFTGKCQQKDKGIIDCYFSATHNQQAKYNTRYGDVPFINNLVLNGADYFVHIDYRKQLFNKLFIKAGLGFMQFRIDEIDNKPVNGIPIRTNGRLIEYPSTVFIGFGTTKYHYNNLVFHLGVERQLPLSRNMSIFAAADYFYAYTMSQYYTVSTGDPAYRPKYRKPFASLINASAGIQIKAGNLSVGVFVVVPVYKIWKQDRVFREDPDKTISNWGHGLGAGLRISYHL